MADKRQRAGQEKRLKVGAHWPHVSRRRHDPAKYAAEAAVTNAVATGRLEQGNCEVCGDPITEAHHDDYTKPLEVRWLCRTHHRAVHGSKVTVAPHDRHSRRRALSAGMPWILSVTQQVRAEMDRQGLTQHDLAKMVGITQPCVHRWFVGGFRTIGSLMLALDALGLEIPATVQSRQNTQVSA